LNNILWLVIAITSQEVGRNCSSRYGDHHAASFATGMNGITTTIVGCS